MLLQKSVRESFSLIVNDFGDKDSYRSLAT